LHSSLSARCCSTGRPAAVPLRCAYRGDQPGHAGRARAWTYSFERTPLRSSECRCGRKAMRGWARTARHSAFRSVRRPSARPLAPAPPGPAPACLHSHGPCIGALPAAHVRLPPHLSASVSRGAADALGAAACNSNDPLAHCSQRSLRRSAAAVTASVRTHALSSAFEAWRRDSRKRCLRRGAAEVRSTHTHTHTRTHARTHTHTPSPPPPKYKHALPVEQALTSAPLPHSLAHNLTGKLQPG
jgi:hypothetical protein